MKRLLLIFIYLLPFLQIFALDLNVRNTVYKNARLRAVKRPDSVKIYHDDGSKLLPLKRLPPITLKTRDGIVYKNVTITSLTRKRVDISSKGKLKSLKIKNLNKTCQTYFYKKPKSKSDKTKDAKSHTFRFKGAPFTLVGKTSSGTRKSNVTPQFKCKIKCFKRSRKCKKNCFDKERLKKDVQQSFNNNVSGGVPLFFSVKVYSSNGKKSADAEVEVENGMSMVTGLLK